jgi:serine/threonine-protein kinase
MGEVWRATDSLLGRGVAVKLLHTRRADDPGFQARFRHEARTMARLHHPGVADVYDYGETGKGDDAYIVMAHVDGQPLDRLIAETGRLDPDTTMSIVAQAARALHAAHAAGIVHRDVKPGNLIICSDGTVVLVDFGIARSAHSVTLTGADEVIGSARYIAPEQVTKDPTGPATDVYALGAVAYHCLAGHPPFLGDNPISVAMLHLHEDPPPLPADLPEPVRDLVTTAMAKSAADRFPSAAAMAEAATAAASTTSAGANAATAAAAPLAAGSGEAVTQPVGASGDSTLVIPPAGQGHGPDSDDPEPGQRRRGRAAVWALLFAALAVVGVALAFALPAMLDPGRSDSPPPTQQQPGASPGAGQGESGEGSGAPAQPGTTPSAGGEGSQPAGQPDATAPGGGNPDNPGPAPSGPGGEDPTPPDDEPTEPEPTQPAEEEEPPASPAGQAPATGAP